MTFGADVDPFTISIIRAFVGIPVSADLYGLFILTCAITFPIGSTRYISDFSSVMGHSGDEMRSFELTKDRDVVEQMLSRITDENSDSSVTVDDVVCEFGGGSDEEPFDVFGIHIKLGPPCREYELDAFGEVIPNLVPQVGICDFAPIKFLGDLVEVNVVPFQQAFPTGLCETWTPCARPGKSYHFFRIAGIIFGDSEDLLFVFGECGRF